MSIKLLYAVPGVLCVSLPALAQNKPVDPGKFRAYGKSYEKALKYCLDHLNEASFMEKVAIGLLLLADGRYPGELDQCLSAAMGAKNMAGKFQFSNWYLGMGGFLLAEAYKYHPREDIRQALEEFGKLAAEGQEDTGGWFDSKNAPKHKGYPAKDHGQLNAMMTTMLLTMKKHKMDYPKDTLQKALACLEKLCSGGGIGYGSHHPVPDTTGSRGGFAVVGMLYAGMRGHKVVSTYSSLLPGRFQSLKKGHHIGGWHFVGVILGCYHLGLLDRLVSYWLAKLVKEQREDGGFYLGDDGADGGEKGLFRGDRASTAALALLILLHNRPDRLNPSKRNRKAVGRKKGGRGGGSPFRRRKR